MLAIYRQIWGTRAEISVLQLIIMPKTLSMPIRKEALPFVPDPESVYLLRR